MACTGTRASTDGMLERVVCADTRLSTFMLTIGEDAGKRDVPVPASMMWELQESAKEAKSLQAGTGSVVRFCGSFCLLQSHAKTISWQCACQLVLLSVPHPLQHSLCRSRSLPAYARASQAAVLTARQLPVKPSKNSLLPSAACSLGAACQHFERHTVLPPQRLETHPQPGGQKDKKKEKKNCCGRAAATWWSSWARAACCCATPCGGPCWR